MDVREVTDDRAFLMRLEQGGDWREQIEALAQREGVASGWFNGIGAVRGAELWYYDQVAGQYEPFLVDEPMEMASCLGNISLLDGEYFAHTHAVLSDPAGRTVSGHLNEAEVFAGEVFIRAFERPLERRHDAQTDLDLWDIAG